MYELISFDEYFMKHENIAQYCILKHNLNNLKDTSFSVEKVITIGDRYGGVYRTIILSGQFKNNFYYAPDITLFMTEEEAIARMKTLIEGLQVGDIRAFRLLFYGDEFYEELQEAK